MDLLKNLKVIISKLHICYEDDYLGGFEKPYSFGLVIHVKYYLID